MTTNWNNTKVYTIPLKGLSHPWEIVNLIKQLGIRKYVYAIMYNNIVVKYGMSDANTTKSGERIYRQVGHLDSFGPNKIVGPNGSEFVDINQRFKDKYTADIDHNGMSITVWSFDNYNFRTMDTVKEITDAESELIETYKNHYGDLPIGNKDDNKFWKRKVAVSRSVYESIFDEETI